MSTITQPVTPRHAAVQPANPAFNPARVGAFMERLLNDISGAMVSLLCALGDRLGLFKGSSPPAVRPPPARSPPGPASASAMPGNGSAPWPAPDTWSTTR